MVDQVLYRVDDVAKLLGLGRSRTYSLIASGELPSLRIGRSIRVSKSQMEAWVEAEIQRQAGVVDPIHPASRAHPLIVG